jgi:hypothetical protein
MAEKDSQGQQHKIRTLPAMEYAGQLLPDHEAVIRMYEERLKEVRQTRKN